MTVTIQEWHNRFLTQAQWTKALRLYFFNLLKSHPLDRILDIGCGTGALLPDLQTLTPAQICGADLSLDKLSIAKDTSPESDLTGADVQFLPYPDNSFDIVLSHYFLMWIKNPITALEEMKRVTRDGGYLVCFAEPDYGGRLDFPTEFNIIRELQIAGLLKAGADPLMGRKLKSHFHTSKLEDIQVGVYEGKWIEDPSSRMLESEWKMLENDLKGIISKEELASLKTKDELARKTGERLIYVPTFYAWGKVYKTTLG
jgi:ubiquinone/menaquinone biosynthesis C-methylase UbiE